MLVISPVSGAGMVLDESPRRIVPMLRIKTKLTNLRLTPSIRIAWLAGWETDRHALADRRSRRFLGITKPNFQGGERPFVLARVGILPCFPQRFSLLPPPEGEAAGRDRETSLPRPPSSVTSHNRYTGSVVQILPSLHTCDSFVHLAHGACFVSRVAVLVAYSCFTLSLHT